MNRAFTYKRAPALCWPSYRLEALALVVTLGFPLPFSLLGRVFIDFSLRLTPLSRGNVRGGDKQDEGMVGDMEGVYKPRGEISPRVGNAWVALPAACYTLGFFTPGSIFPLPPPTPEGHEFHRIGVLILHSGEGGIFTIRVILPIDARVL